MSVIVWILLGLALAVLTSRIVSTTGEGTVVDILIGIVGAVIGGALLSLFYGTGITGFDLDSLWSTIAAAIGAAGLLAVYHMFFRRRML